jgi:hypothetical protein
MAVTQKLTLANEIPQSNVYLKIPTNGLLVLGEQEVGTMEVDLVLADGAKYSASFNGEAQGYKAVQENPGRFVIKGTSPGSTWRAESGSKASFKHVEGPTVRKNFVAKAVEFKVKVKSDAGVLVMDSATKALRFTQEEHEFDVWTLVKKPDGKILLHYDGPNWNLLAVNVNNRVSNTTNRGTWEAFSLISVPNDPNGSFALRSWLGTYLSRDAEGKLGVTADANQATFGNSEHFSFEYISGFPKRLLIKSAKGYLCSSTKMELRESAGSWEKFDFVLQPDGRVAIKDKSGKFLNAKASGQVVVEDNEEPVKLILCSNGCYALQFPTNKYLTVGLVSEETKQTGNGGVYAAAETIGEMEMFEIVEI